jgi:hypothetical protein
MEIKNIYTEFWRENFLEMCHLKGQEENGRYCDELIGCEMAGAIHCLFNDAQITSSRKVE